MMNVTYEEFMDLQIDRLSKKYENITKIERSYGVNNSQSNEFKLYFQENTPKIIIKITPGQPHDFAFKLVKTWKPIQFSQS